MATALLAALWLYVGLLVPFNGLQVALSETLMVEVFNGKENVPDVACVDARSTLLEAEGEQDLRCWLRLTRATDCIEWAWHFNSRGQSLRRRAARHWPGEERQAAVKAGIPLSDSLTRSAREFHSRRMRIGSIRVS